MAIRIENVKLTTNYSWQNVKNLADWNSVKNTNFDWKQPLQTAIIGQQVKIEVEVIENSWAGINNITIIPNPVNVGQSYVITVDVSD